MNSHKDVPIEITSRHEAVSDRMREHALEKAQKLVRFHNRVSRIQVVIDGAHEQPDVEMIVHVDSGATFVSREHAEHFRAAMDAAVDKMERQLKKDQEKRRHHKGDVVKGAEPLADDRDAEDTYDDIVRRDLNS